MRPLPLLLFLVGCDGGGVDTPLAPPPDSPTPIEARREIAYVYHGVFYDSAEMPILDAAPEAVEAFVARSREADAVRRDEEARDHELFLELGGLYEEPEVPVGIPRGPPNPVPPLSPTATAYMTDCDTKKVPIPPKWGDPLWKQQKDLPPEFVAASEPRYRTEIWTYENDNGVCVALPRVDVGPPPPGKGIVLLGIICQSRITEYACFWDNVDRGTGNRIEGAANTGKGPEDTQDGNSLTENCTNCHRGSNAFNVYPGTDLDLPAPGTQPGKKPYKPVSSQPTWGNPAGAIAMNSCADCHRIPALTKDYCRTILRKALKPAVPPAVPPPPTMPEPPAKWDDPDYKADVTALQEACYRFDPDRNDPAKRDATLDFGLGIPIPP